MTYGLLAIDTIQSSTTGTPTQFQDGSGTQIGTLCRAWVNYKGTSTQSIRGSFNVSSVTYNSTGNYTINFTNAMSDVNYAALVSSDFNGATNGQGMGAYPMTRNTGSVVVITPYYNATYYDQELVALAVFR